MREFWMPEYFQSSVWVQAWENVHRDDEFLIVLLQSTGKPVKLEMAIVKITIGFCREIHGIKSDELDISIWELIAVVTSLHESLFCLITFEVLWKWTAFWEPDVK